MNKSYVFVPLVLMDAFATWAIPAGRERDRVQAQAEADAAARAAAEEVEQAQRIEAERRQQEARRLERERVEAERLAQRRAAQEAADRDLADTLRRALADRAAAEAENARLAAELSRRQQELARTDTALAEQVRAVELLQIERRTADLELQRAMRSVADRTAPGTLDETSLFPAPARTRPGPPRS